MLTFKSENKVEKSTLKGTYKNIDWTSKSHSIKDQGACGSCWAFAASAVAEATLAIEHGWDAQTGLSEQQQMDCAYLKWGNLACSGGLMANSWKYFLANPGWCSDEQYPYEAKKGTCRDESCKSGPTVASWTPIDANDCDGVASALEGKPVAVGIAAGTW